MCAYTQLSAFKIFIFIILILLSIKFSVFSMIQLIKKQLRTRQLTTQDSALKDECGCHSSTLRRELLKTTLICSWTRVRGYLAKWKGRSTVILRRDGARNGASTWWTGCSPDAKRLKMRQICIPLARLKTPLPLTKTAKIAFSRMRLSK